MKIYGYCRVSTKKQSLERQEKNITSLYPNAEIYAEKFTGTTTNRPQWQKLLKAVHEGDTIVFDSVSRMSRNAEEGFQDYKALFEMGVNLVFLNEHYIDTDTYRQAMRQQIDSISTGDKATDNFINAIMTAIKEYKLTLAERQIQLAFEQSEKEVKDIQQRTREGMEAAGATGKNGAGKISRARTGKKFITKKEVQAKELILKHSRAFGGTLKDAECMKLCGISFATYYQYKKELKADQSEKE